MERQELACCCFMRLVIALTMETKHAGHDRHIGMSFLREAERKGERLTIYKKRFVYSEVK